MSKRVLYVLNLMKPLSQLKPSLVRWFSTQSFFFVDQRHSKETRGPKVLKRMLSIFVRLFFNHSFFMFLIKISFFSMLAYFVWLLPFPRYKGANTQNLEFLFLVRFPMKFAACMFFNQIDPALVVSEQFLSGVWQQICCSFFCFRDKT